jgi:hypothetical protein
MQFLVDEVGSRMVPVVYQHLGSAAGQRALHRSVDFLREQMTRTLVLRRATPDLTVQQDASDSLQVRRYE